MAYVASSVAGAGVAEMARSYQSVGTSTATRLPWRVRSTCWPCHCARLTTSANCWRASWTLTSCLMRIDGTALIVCKELTDWTVCQLTTRSPESRSRAFWSWFASKHPARSRHEPTPDHPTTAEPASHEGPTQRQITHTRSTRRGFTVGYALTASGQRRTPNAATRRDVLEAQRNRCLYCENTFGSIIRRGHKTISLRLNWDHFVPYSYGLTNGGDNWVAACHVCNGIKSNRMFETVARAKTFILARWAEKGYDLKPILTVQEIRRGGRLD